MIPEKIFDGPRAELAPEVAALPRGSLFLGYQSKAHLLASTTRLLLVEKSRRIGLTWALAALAVLTAAKDRSAKGMNAYYISYAKEMTRDFIDACAMWARVFNLAAHDAEETLFEDVDEHGGESRFIQAFRIRFSSGFSVVALSSAPHSLRGKQGLAIVDEAAFVKDLAALIKAVMAFLMWGGRVCVVSTHNGADNLFNVLKGDILAGKRAGKVLTITLKDAIADGLFERVKLVGATELETAEEWEAEIRAFYAGDVDEELDCIPRTGAGSWLELADIIAAQHPDAGKPELYAKGNVGLGWDVARRTHGSIMAPFEDVGGTLWLREQVEMRNTRFSEQYTEFDRLMKAYSVGRARIDQSGMGEAVVDRCIEEHGAELVEGVLFNPTSKLVLATALREELENGVIRLPPDPAVTADLRSIKRKRSTGDVTLLSDDGTSDGHSDRFWAYALAVTAARLGVSPIAFASTGLRGSMLGERPALGGAGFGSVASLHDLGGY